MSNVEEIILRLKDQFSKNFREAFDKAKAMRKQAQALQGDFGKLETRARQAFLAFGAVQLVKGVANLGIEMEQTRIAFTTFLGDADKANKTISELNEFSNVTPFTNDEVIKAGKSLLAFGTPVEQLKTDLKAIGDISAGTGKDFNELSTIYGKARIAGTLYAEDINQLVEAGVPIIGQFAKQMGVSEKQVKTLASEGKIGFGQLETAFQTLTGEGGQFSNLMEKQSKTVGGQISTLEGQLQTFGVNMGEALLPVIQSVIDKVKIMSDWVIENKDSIAKWVPIVAKIVGIIGALILIIKAWIGVQTIINFLLTANPIGLMIVGIVALIAAITWLVNKAWEATNGFTEFNGILSFMFLPVILLVKGFMLLSDWLKDMYERGTWVTKIVDEMRFQFELLKLKLKALGEWFTDLPNKAVSAFEVIKAKVMGFVDVLSGAFDVLMNPFDEEGRAAGMSQLKKGLEDFNQSAGDIYRKAYEERKKKQLAEEAKIDAEMRAKEGLDPASPSSDPVEGTGLGNLLGGGLAGGGTGLGNLLGDGSSGGGGGKVSSGLSGVSSVAPKNITITIEKLVEKLSVNTTTLKEGTAQVQEEITKALLTAINDAQIQGGA